MFVLIQFLEQCAPVFGYGKTFDEAVKKSGIIGNIKTFSGSASTSDLIGKKLMTLDGELMIGDMVVMTDSEYKNIFGMDPDTDF